MLDVVLYFVGVAGVAAAITLGFLADRAVMDVGGMCAEGGPYVIAQHCPRNTELMIPLAFLGAAAAIVLTAWKGSTIGGGAGSVALLAWPAAFGAVGFTSLQYGLDPPGDQPGWVWGWLVMGIIFLAMALIPLLLGIAVILGVGSDRGSAGRPAAPAPQSGASRAVEDDVTLDIVTGARVLDGAGGSRDEGPAEASGERRVEPLVGGLERLTALHEGGALTDDEFAVAKHELLEGDAT